MDDIELLLKVEKRRSAEKVHLLYLKNLHKGITILTDIPTGGDYFDISMPKDINIDGEIETILNVFAMKLLNNKLIGLKMFKYENTILLKTENANVS